MEVLRRHRASFRFVWTAVALVAGEAAGFSSESCAALWPWAAVALGLFLLFAFGWNLRFAVLPTIFAVGMVLAWRTDDRLAELARCYSSRYVSRPATVELDVAGEVEVRQRRDGQGVVVSFPSYIGPMELKVVALLPESASLPKPGERWRCCGWLSEKKDAPNRYSRRTLWVMEGRTFERMRAASPFSPTAIASRCSRVLAEKASIGLACAPDIASMNHAILLGRRENFPRARRLAFVTAGTIHVFAISGLHVMLVAGLLGRLIRSLAFYSRVANLVCIVAVPCYAMLTGLSPSALRAATMTVLWLSAPFFGRRSDCLVAWSITAVGVYALHPERVFDIGCSFSFTVIFGLLFWVRWKECNGLSLTSFFGLNDRLRLVDGLLISLAAWVAGVPLAAHVFGRMTFGGLIINAVVMAAAGVTVAFGAMGIASGFFSSVLAAFFNGLAACCMYGMARISELIASIPWLSCTVRPWTGLECAAWYGFWVLVLMTAEKVLKSRRRYPWDNCHREASPHI